MSQNVSTSNGIQSVRFSDIGSPKYDVEEDAPNINYYLHIICFSFCDYFW